MIKLAIVDDDRLIRTSLSMLISMEDDIELVAEGENGHDAVRIMKEKEVDCLLLDMRMPELDGIEALKQIEDKDKVLILSTFDEERYIIPAIKMGAKGYILKNSQPDQIISAIRQVKNKVNVLGDKVMDVLRESINSKGENEIFKDLSEREIEVCKLIATGLSNKEIADELYLSEGTVKNYISSILLKTGLNHRTQVAIHWLKK